LTGEYFAPGLSVWFGETESPSTDYRYDYFLLLLNESLFSN
jgi:hypothetical protein